MDKRHADTDIDNPGLFDSMTAVGKNLFGLAVNRVELAALELGEARDQLARLLLVGALGLIAAWCALACWTVLLVILMWDAMGWTGLLLVASVYTLLAIGTVLYVHAKLKSGGLSLPATMTELRKDRDALL